MTQQFKFGDMVKSRMHPNKTLGLVVDAGSNQYSYIIRWEHTKGVSQEHTESLELIPHPDTVRLDWLLENSGINVGEEDYYRRNYVYDRDAIDTQYLSDEEIDWINAYHKMIWEKIGPLLSGKEKSFLKKATGKITRA